MTSTLNNFNLIQLNIRNLNNSFDQLLIFLKSIKDKFDVTILSETGNIEDISRLNITGYYLFHNDN